MSELTWSKRLRLLRMGLQTVLASCLPGRVRPRGFFLPYHQAPLLSRELPPYQPIEALFHAAEPVFHAVLRTLDGYREALLAIGEAPPPAPRWTQGWFPRLDAAVAYAMVRARRPKRIVEIGSGHSTRFLARAVADQGLQTELTAIDPRPRTDIATLPLHRLEMTVQEAGLEPFVGLAEGDILFIDSSHIAMPGSDVDFLAGRVIPALPKGVLIHLHDICLPDDYFRHWWWRGYNEQGIAAALLAGGGFVPLWASHYAVTRMAEAVAGSVAAQLPLPEGAPETSLWLEKRAAPVGPLQPAPQPQSQSPRQTPPPDLTQA